MPKKSMSRMFGIAVTLTLIAGCTGSPPASPAATGDASPAATGDASPAATSDAGPLTKIQMVYGAGLTPDAAYLWVGQELGYFAEEGIELEVLTLAGNVLATQVLASRSVEMIFGGTEGILSAEADGVEIEVVNVYNALREPTFEWVTVPESGVTELADLRGKNIGVLSMGSGTVVFAEATLREAGIEPGEYEILPIGVGAQAASALTAGQVDAYASYDINDGTIRLQGTELIDLPTVTPPQACACGGIHVTAEFADENPELLEGFLRAVAKGTTFWLENPVAATQIHYEMFPDTVPSNMDPDTVVEDMASVFSPYAGKIDPAETGADNRYGAVTEDEWNYWAEFNGFSPGSYAQLHDDRFLDAANDFDAEAIREQARDYQP